MEITLTTTTTTIFSTETPTNFPIKRTTLMLILDASIAINLGIECKIARLQEKDEIRTEQKGKWDDSRSKC